MQESNGKGGVLTMRRGEVFNLEPRSLALFRHSLKQDMRLLVERSPV